MIAAGAAALALLIALAVFFIVRARRRRAPAACAGGVTLSVGKVHETGARESQQDCFAVLPEELWPEHGLLAVVADGMGRPRGRRQGQPVRRERFFLTASATSRVSRSWCCWSC